MADKILPFSDREPTPENMRNSMRMMDAVMQDLARQTEATKHAVDALLRTPDHSLSVESIRTLIECLMERANESMNCVNAEAEHYGAPYRKSRAMERAVCDQTAGLTDPDESEGARHG